MVMDYFPTEVMRQEWWQIMGLSEKIMPPPQVWRYGCDFSATGGNDGGEVPFLSTA